jgi:acyl-CoA synthetase (NDP forming)
MRSHEAGEGWESLEGFLRPRSIAVVGASADPNKGGHAIVANLTEYCGEELYPVNPRYREICGIACYRSVEDLPKAVDMAILFVPAREVPGVIAQCGRKGVARVMIQSAGFAETGEAGRILEQRCVQEARRWGIRLWGPNCMGVVNGRERMVASFMRPHVWKEILRPGDVSLVVQSGMASAGFLMQVMSEGYFGLSKACSIGNRCDINECDLLEYFAQDQDTRVVAMYLESVSDPPRFRRAVQRLGKPLVLLRGGTSPGGAEAARSHTGSLAGDAGVAEGFFKQLGIERAYDFVELMDLAKALSSWKGRRGGPKAAVVTFSGAAGIVASDHLARHGMALAGLSPATREMLKQVFPPWMEPSNPVDIWPAIEKSGRKAAYQTSLRALVEDPGVEAIHVHLYVDRALLEGSWELLEPLRGWHGRAALWLIGDTRCFRELRERVEPMGIPVYGEIQRGVRALSLWEGRRWGWHPADRSV